MLGFKKKAFEIHKAADVLGSSKWYILLLDAQNDL